MHPIIHPQEINCLSMVSRAICSAFWLGISLSDTIIWREIHFRPKSINISWV